MTNLRDTHDDGQGNTHRLAIAFLQSDKKCRSFEVSTQLLRSYGMMLLDSVIIPVIVYVSKKGFLIVAVFLNYESKNVRIMSLLFQDIS